MNCVDGDLVLHRLDVKYFEEFTFVNVEMKVERFRFSYLVIQLSHDVFHSYQID